MESEADATRMSVAAGVCDDQRVSFVAQFSDGSPHTPKDNDAYVLVRVAEPHWPTGSVTVYLPDGTALVVPGKDLLRLIPVGAETPTPKSLHERWAINQSVDGEARRLSPEMESIDVPAKSGFRA